MKGLGQLATLSPGNWKLAEALPPSYRLAGSEALGAQEPLGHQAHHDREQQSYLLSVGCSSQTLPPFEQGRQGERRQFGAADRSNLGGSRLRLKPGFAEYYFTGAAQPHS